MTQRATERTGDANKSNYITGFASIILAGSLAQAQDNYVGVIGNDYSAGLVINPSIEIIARESIDPKNYTERTISRNQERTIGVRELPEKFSLGAQLCIDSDYSGCNSQAGVYFNKHLIGAKYKNDDFSIGAGYVRTEIEGGGKNKFFGAMIEYKH